MIKPGQIWKWDFTVSDGWWLFDVVSEERRNNPFTRHKAVMLQRGYVFTIVSTNDSGPADMNDIFDLDFDLPSFNSKQLTWYTALHESTVFWISDELMKHATLVKDV